MSEEISDGRNVWVIEGDLVRGVTGDPRDNIWWVALPADGQVWQLTDALRQEIERVLPHEEFRQAQLEDHEVAEAMTAIACRGRCISGEESPPFEGV